MGWAFVDGVAVGGTDQRSLRRAVESRGAVALPQRGADCAYHRTGAAHSVGEHERRRNPESIDPMSKLGEDTEINRTDRRARLSPLKRQLFEQKLRGRP